MVVRSKFLDWKCNHPLHLLDLVIYNYELQGSVISAELSITIFTTSVARCGNKTTHEFKLKEQQVQYNYTTIITISKMTKYILK